MAEQPHEIVWRLSTAGVAARCRHSSPTSHR